MAKCVEELLVYQKAMAAADAVSAIMRRSALQKDRRLTDQLGESSSRVPSHIAEGFEQKSDRHFAHYLYIARGSAKETKTHLRIAKGRGHVSTDELVSLCGRYDEIGKMLTGLIQYLERGERTRRW